MTIATDIRLGTGPEVFSESGLASQFHGAFILASVYSLLRELGAPSTKVSIQTADGWRPLRQFDPLPWDEHGTLELRASGELGRALAEGLPGRVLRRLSRTEFDPDGFAYTHSADQSERGSVEVSEMVFQ